VEEENLVKKTCRELGITQKELAERIGVSRVSINEWANNKTPTPKWAEKTIKLLSEVEELQTFKNSIKNLIKSDRNILLSLEN
jgi:transcriptional regulator with XRE-family HTH domain